MAKSKAFKLRTKHETYPEARLRLFAALSQAGHKVKPALKVPQVQLTTGETLYFRPQAVYLESHSLWIDIRGMGIDDFLHAVSCAKKARQLAADCTNAGLPVHNERILIRSDKSLLN